MFTLYGRNIWSKNLFRSQAFHRVRYSRLNCLEAYGEQGNKHGHQGCNNKYYPTDTRSVRKTLQPFIHNKPCDGGTDNDGDGTSLRKSFESSVTILVTLAPNTLR